LNSGGEIVGFRRATLIGLVKEPDRPAVRLTQAGSIKGGLPVLPADIRILAWRVMGKVHFHHAVVEPDVLTMGKGDLQKMLGKVNSDYLPPTAPFATCLDSYGKLAFRTSSH
jgi:hypothetical protein